MNSLQLVEELASLGHFLSEVAYSSQSLMVDLTGSSLAPVGWSSPQSMFQQSR